MFTRLYIHVPFCIEKCRYCAFVSGKAMHGDLAGYPSLLSRELALLPPGDSPLDSIYFGGGTPSLLEPSAVARLLVGIDAHTGFGTDAEITLEANPGSIDGDQLKRFRDAGINRLSLGIQSFDDDFLKKLGRVHSAEQAQLVFQEARSAGFNNISIDLIHSLPGQTLLQWRSDLQYAIALTPEHVSIYGLTIEPGTPFAELYPDGTAELADEDLSADMFELTDDMLTAAGFDHYEIANYGRPGFRSQHNCGYWQRHGYRGLGVAAHSFLREGHGVRFSNPDSLEAYRDAVVSGQLLRIDEQHLTARDAMAEYLFLGLRLAEGVSPAAFEREFGCTLEVVYGDAITELIQFGLLITNGDMIFLTRRGMLLSNQVFSRFV